MSASKLEFMAKVIITTPHSSSFIPTEFLDRFELPEEQIHQIFDFGTYEVSQLIKDENIIVLSAEVSRLIVDLNRFPDDSRNIGVFREKTFKGFPIFKEGCGFTEKEKDYLKEKYYFTWHNKFIEAITKEPIFMHIDLHNTDETKFCLSAYTPGKTLRMEDFTDLDIANRSAYKNPYQSFDSAGLTCPGEEIEFMVGSANKHFNNFISNPRITASGFMRGGAIIQIARNKANWLNGISRSVQFEIQRKHFANPLMLAEALKGLIADTVNQFAGDA